MACWDVNQANLSVGKLAIRTKSHMYITFHPVILHLKIYPREINKHAPKDLDKIFMQQV